MEIVLGKIYSIKYGGHMYVGGYIDVNELMCKIIIYNYDKEQYQMKNIIRDENYFFEINEEDYQQMDVRGKGMLDIDYLQEQLDRYVTAAKWKII